MSSTTKTLSNNPQELQKTVVQLQQKTDKLQQKVNWYEEQFRLMQQKRFASSSEKSDDKQLNLFNEAELLVDEQEAIAEPETETVTYTRKKPGRKALPDDIPREEVRYELSESEQVCGCGHKLHVCGEDTSEQLEIIPAQVKVIKHIQVKYACRACEQGIKTVPKPPQPIERSIATPSLLAYVIVSKFCDSLPLYRQEGIFKRLKIDIPRASMSNWVLKSSQYLQPYYKRLHDYLRLQKIIQADETTLRVIHDKREGTPKSYMWVYQSGGYQTEHPIVLYDYQATRAGQHAKQFLAGFTGHLQVDGFAGYHVLLNQENEVILVGCMAHARRKFDEALKALPKKNKTKPGMAQTAISKIAKLYAIEKQIQHLTIEQRFLLRQENSKPILEDLKAWCDKSVVKTLKDSLIGKAIRYMLNQWNYIVCYIDDGNLHIDNNAAERSIKPFVIGRKNWLFNQTPSGADASALLYSLVQTAKANNLEPFAFLKHILTEIPKLGRHYQPEELDQFMPWRLTDKIQLLNKKE